jgi:hypothetical protein
MSQQLLIVPKAMVANMLKLSWTNTCGCCLLRGEPKICRLNTRIILKLNTFANFEGPSKIAHRNFFFGRLKS